MVSPSYAFHASRLILMSLRVKAGMPDPIQIFERLTSFIPRRSLDFVLISLVPLPKELWLGNSGEPYLMFVAPLVLIMSTGVVFLSWFIIRLWLTAYGRVVTKLVTYAFQSNLSSKSLFTDEARSLNTDSGREVRIPRRMGLITVGIMSTLVFLFVPWQVAFLAFYIIHFNHCALLVVPPEPTDDTRSLFKDARNQRLLILLIMTWCLPVVAPVLAVWVRTLFTAGLTTPFDGDHNPLNVLSFMALTFVATSLRGSLISQRHRCVFSIQFSGLGALIDFKIKRM